MTQPVIGILGASGSVGSAALACLQGDSNLVLRAAYYSRAPQQPDKRRTTWSRVNIYDESALARFCSECTVVLNTAGPSIVIADHIARAADQAGAHYVDAFGGCLLAKRLQERPLSTGRCVIHSAGIYPGLSELLPRWLADTHFDSVHLLHGWSGGREACSAAAAADVLLSTQQGFGRAGAIWENGRRMTNAMAAHDFTDLPGFPGRVRVQPFLSAELEDMACYLNLHDAQWGNVMTSARTLEVIAHWSGRLSLHPGTTSTGACHDLLEQAVDELVDTARRDLLGHTAYYRLVIEMEGSVANKPRRLRAVLKAKNSYQVGGAVAADAVSTLIHNPPQPGVYRAASVLNWDEVLRSLQHNRSIEDFTIVAVPPPSCNRTAGKVEEGSL